MKIIALLPALVLLWPMAKLLKKGWRLLALLVAVALVGGCANSSNKFEKSPCACEFAPINTGDYGSKTHA
ncbi:hypothetical protein [Caballeronia zhejiangensis]|uniref:hypothetical protein n=1 Tax=Caballeronia zhejiangensis TaxID=871203 RepID=UPI001588421A|nr:hypothetical protein [Caballeronia zhejiangensis]